MDESKGYNQMDLIYIVGFLDPPNWVWDNYVIHKGAAL